jgi:hypothetical protein
MMCSSEARREAERVGSQIGASAADAVSLNEKVAFLSGTQAYSPAVPDVAVRETHMSWVFLAGDEAWEAIGFGKTWGRPRIAR